MTFATDRPVFDNPTNVPGFTVASPSGAIIANTYVPEPVSLSLGLAILALSRRSRRHCGNSCR